MRRRNLHLIALSALPLSGLSCRAAVARVFHPPSVTFRGAALRTVGIGGGTIDVMLAIRNPNPYSLTATHASYRLLAADSSEVGHGEALESTTVGAHDSANVVLPLEVSWKALGRAGRAAAGTGSVVYRVLGDVTVKTPIGERQVPLDARGRAMLPSGLPFGR